MLTSAGHSHCTRDRKDVLRSLCIYGIYVSDRIPEFRDLSGTASASEPDGRIVESPESHSKPREGRIKAPTPVVSTRKYGSTRNFDIILRGQSA